ncbi:helix-turn-helix domain-containing protein [Nubsella zeaxanthinifaciens]|uniref:helix-turn-helix domain-containing protein n=1 Tax=Nubsella zeaxanthinifaciens TaxID=392412 RepID=UPI000DE3E38F|nr:helix-turn-helix transcriptional regulator [Nubsella zeaxanthinifaciens]
MKNIGQIIREIRQLKRKSQNEVAFEMEMSQAAYSKIERGKTEIKASQLYKLADILHVSIHDLLPPDRSLI